MSATRSLAATVDALCGDLVSIRAPFGMWCTHELGIQPAGVAPNGSGGPSPSIRFPAMNVTRVPVESVWAQQGSVVPLTATRS